MPTDKDALAYAVELAQPHYYTDEDGREWSDKQLKPVRSEIFAPIEVSTLSGLVDLIGEKVNDFKPGEVLVHVAGHDHVHLIARVPDPWGRRHILVSSILPQTEEFEFGEWLDHEEFLIGVLAKFTATPDRDYLIGIATHIEAGRARVSLDDGVSQAVTLKQGASLKTEAAIRNRLALAPFRTFREVAQPASEFLFRLRGGGDNAPPMLALYEADGGKWKIDAMETIGRYLRTTLINTIIPVVI